jgi:hypothetical protein
VGRLKIVASIETALDTSQTNARSMASSKGWRVDGVTTPYVRVCGRVMPTNIRPLRWGADGATRIFIFAVLPSYRFLRQAPETAEEDFWLSAESARGAFQQYEA